VNALPLITAAMTLAIAAGCGSAKRVSSENDRLRAQVLDLQDENRSLASQVEELQGQFDRATGESSVPRAVLAATPHVASLSIDSLSHTVDTDDDGYADTLTVYVSPSDGLGRLVQLVGDLSIHVALLPPDGDAVTMGRVSLGPQELRDAYHSTWLGTHYTVAVPITIPRSVTEPTGCTLRVEFVDGYSGRRVTSQQTLDLEP
jgi:hypothetical protein